VKSLNFGLEFESVLFQNRSAYLISKTTSLGNKERWAFVLQNLIHLGSRNSEIQTEKRAPKQTSEES